MSALIRFAARVVTSLGGRLPLSARHAATVCRRRAAVVSQHSHPPM
jgi:hypothetical protein